MKPEVKRLFISDLPEQINEQELQSKFADFGLVTSLEIKERKNIGPKNSSRYFAYINLETDSANLQKCLKTVPETKWKGYFVNVQIARENFLDRLKKEREESHKVVQEKKVEIKKQSKENNGISNGFTSNKRYYESDDETIDAVETDGFALNKRYYISDDETINTVKTDPSIVIKNNRAKILDKSKKLKIESVGYEPVLIIEPKKTKSKDPKRMEADMKRIQSIMQMKKEYNQQKNIIKTSLSNVDFKPKNKIIFDEDDNDNIFNHKNSVSNDSNSNEKKSKTLFSDDEEDDADLNFDVKEQFLGKKGQKLLQLQSKFKNDSRFKMDSRFLEDEENEQEEFVEVEDDKTLEEEKQTQYKILEEVLGTKIAPRQKPPENHKMKSMLRFDPTQPEHSKYEVKPTVITDKNKKKSKREQSEINQIEENKPEVSKETFYKVTSDLREALQEKESFSLLSMFGKDNEEDKSENECTSDAVEKPSSVLNKFATQGDNPFRYDSSDDESECLEKIDEVTQKTQVNPHWNEMFFFKEDDYRFQEGFDFIKRLEMNSNEEFSKIRTDLKQIIKTKVRNNLRKNKPFKKKLGGNNNKRIRMKKALKR